jgi:hypothetical protein
MGTLFLLELVVPDLLRGHLLLHIRDGFNIEPALSDNVLKEFNDACTN